MKNVTIAFANTLTESISKLEFTGKLETIKSLLHTESLGHISLCNYTVWYDLHELANEKVKYALLETEEDQYLTPVPGNFIVQPNEKCNGSGNIKIFFDFNECKSQITTLLSKKTVLQETH